MPRFHTNYSGLSLKTEVICHLNNLIKANHTSNSWKSPMALLSCHIPGWKTHPVCRVRPILTRPWVRQLSRTSGSDALKPCKNLKVCYCTLGTTAQTYKLENMRGAKLCYLRHLRNILGVPLPYFAFWKHTGTCSRQPFKIILLHCRT